MRILVIASGNQTNISPFVEEQVNSLKTMGIFIDYFLIKGKGIGGYLNNHFKLIKYLKDNHYDLLHAHYGLSGLLATIQTQVPVIITFHGSDVNFKKNYLFSRLASRLSTTNIFVHPNLSRKLKIFSNKQNIIPCGVDLNTFYPMKKSNARSILGWNDNTIYVLFSSAFNNPIKNAPLAKTALKNFRNTKLIELKNYSKKEINLLMNASDLLLVTSYSETGPVVVKEALACNCPIISTNVGDVKKITKNVNNCYLTNYDPMEIEQKIKIILDSKKESNGRTAVKPFALNIIAKKVFGVYQTVAKNYKAP